MSKLEKLRVNSSIEPTNVSLYATETGADTKRAVIGVTHRDGNSSSSLLCDLNVEGATVLRDWLSRFIESAKKGN